MVFPLVFFGYRTIMPTLILQALSPGKPGFKRSNLLTDKLFG
jgi:hypothetical protein